MAKDGEAENRANLPALTRQVSELVLAGSLGHAEQAFSEAAEQHGDLAVVEVLGTLPPPVRNSLTPFVLRNVARM